MEPTSNETWECDSCGKQKPVDELLYFVIRRADLTDPEEGVDICKECRDE